MSIALPVEGESVRCSVFAADNGIDPGGTGLAPDAVVLVEVPEPWPKPAGKHPAMVEWVSAAAMQPAQIRLLAAVPHDPAAPRVICFRPTPGGMLRSVMAMSDDAATTLQALLDVEPEVVSGGPDAPRTLLVCTQGSHDVCCGEAGNDFADAVSTAYPGVELFRVSHTGGHRFSPTAMTLPDGRMWAFLDTDRLGALLDRTMAPEDAASMCRGWWGTPTGPSQVAERAVFGERGFSMDDEARQVVSVEADGHHLVTVTVGSDAPVEVEVRVGREVPTIACEAPGGQPVKPGREWSARIR